MSDFSRAPVIHLAPVSLPPLCAPEARKWVLTTAILASSLGFIDGSVTSIAMPAMRASLAASLVEAQWIGNAYLLALSALVLAGGAMGDRFGVARVFGAGIAVFVVASLVCAVAPTAGALIAARVVQGVGAALMVPGSMAIIARAYPKAERGRALGIWAAASAITTAAGPILGGLLLTWGPDWSWRLIFAVNLPLGAFAIWILATKVRADPSRPEIAIDMVGALLATAGLGLAAYALTDPGPRATVTLAAGAAALALFVLWEARAAHPMMRLGLFRDRGFSAANVATFFLYFALSAVLFFLPMTAISAWGATEIEVTAAFVPLSVLIGALSTPAGRMADKIGAGPMIAGGSALVGLAYGALALTAGEADFWGRAVPAMTVAGLGMALVVAPLSAGVMARVSEAEQGAASGINNAVSRVAGLVAVALLGPVAASAYAKAGGAASFGEPGVAGAAHAAATSAGFGAVAGIAAACALVAALAAATGLRRERPEQA